LRPALLRALGDLGGQTDRVQGDQLLAVFERGAAKAAVAWSAAFRMSVDSRV
jgi:class 3 adenylate cyclase